MVLKVLYDQTVSSVMLGKIFHLSELQFSHLYSGDKIHLIGLLCHRNKRGINTIPGR